MLCLGSGSVCDVCLEPFGVDQKAPCSIICGHVFCAGCLNHITRPACPLCRIPFNLGSHVKLHVDVDSKSPANQQHHTKAEPNVEAEARRLQDAIATVANQGSSEAGLCRLIAECRAFLTSNRQFTDLLVSYRMVSYIYEIKSSLREKERLMEIQQANIELLQAEMQEVEDKLCKSEADKQNAREAALAIEMSLRGHCERTQTSYTELSK
ncbi:hypothetical protein C8J56DRAFT_1006019 [Mycena floridula]|nr:hypothetical protein C8J56DRAFT_1006019 [Mycena floridula]